MIKHDPYAPCLIVKRPRKTRDSFDSLSPSGEYIKCLIKREERIFFSDLMASFAADPDTDIHTKIMIVRRLKEILLKTESILEELREDDLLDQ